MVRNKLNMSRGARALTEEGAGLGYCTGTPSSHPVNRISDRHD